MFFNVTAPINKLSYGYASLNILKALHKQNHGIALFPIGQQIEVSSKEEENLVRLWIQNNRLPDWHGPSIRIWHQFDLAQHVSSPRIGFPIFELDRFTPQELHHLGGQDILLVCSNWAKSVINRWLPDKPCFVVPLGVDREVFKPAQRPPNKNMVILNIGKIEIRKGHDFLLEAFNNAFCPSSNVELWMAWSNPFLKEDEVKNWENLYLNSEMGRAGKIRFVPRLSSQEELVQVMNAADIGFFPSRAEGWNLPALEMLACGKRLIATNYSAHTEFLSPTNSLLIDVEETESAYDGRWFFSQGNWAKLGTAQMEQAVAHLKTCYEDFSVGPITFSSNEEGIKTAEHFSWENSAQTLVEIFE